MSAHAAPLNVLAATAVIALVVVTARVALMYAHGATAGLVSALMKGDKRSVEQLEAQTKDTLAYIKKNPGQRAEKISAGVRLATSDLVLPIKKLLTAKALAKPKGRRPGTTVQRTPLAERTQSTVRVARTSTQAAKKIRSPALR